MTGKHTILWMKSSFCVVLLLQPKTEDSHRLKIYVLDNDVEKNVLKTSDASCLCEVGLTSGINDCPITVFGNVRIPPFIYNYQR